jgi:hypothetical protein
MCDLPAGADRTWLGPYSTARDRIVLGSKRSSVRRKQQAAAAGKSSRSGSHIKFYPGWNCDGHMVSHQYTTCVVISQQPASPRPRGRASTSAARALAWACLGRPPPPASLLPEAGWGSQQQEGSWQCQQASNPPASRQWPM